MKRKDIFAFCFNISLILLEVLGIIFLFTIPLERFKQSSIADWTSFWYFTTDSNILMLIACSISVGYMIAKFKGKIKTTPQWVDIVKLTATASVALTMFVTVFFLTFVTKASGKFPTESLFLGSNLMFHVICPSVAIVIFLLFENRKDIKLIKTLYCLIPVIIYGIFYLVMAYTHVKTDGTFMEGYDWYGFCSFGKVATPFVLIAVFGFFYLFSWLLWLGNKKINIKSLA